MVGHISGGSTLGTPTPAGLQPNPFEGGITAASYVGISPGAPALPGQGQGGLCLGSALSSRWPSTRAPNLPLLPSIAAELTPLLLSVLSLGAGATVATRIKKQAMMGLGLAASPSSLPEPLQCSQATPAFLSVWLCAHRYCLQSYMQLPAGATLHLPGNSAADLGEQTQGSSAECLPFPQPSTGLLRLLSLNG